MRKLFVILFVLLHVVFINPDKSILSAGTNNTYLNNVNLNLRTTKYAKVMAKHFRMSKRELAFLANKGFVVLGKRTDPTFASSYKNIYYNHLPVFITTDSILHAFHRSFSDALKEIEEFYLMFEIKEILNRVKSKFSIRRSDSRLIKRIKKDLSTFCNVGLYLIKEKVPAHQRKAMQFMSKIYKGKMSRVKFFGENRAVDFSQFKPRGHYTETKGLKKYFRLMMWLGRMYFDLNKKKQAIACLLFSKAVKDSGMYKHWKKANDLIELLVGKSPSLGFLQSVPFLHNNNVRMRSIINNNKRKELINKLVKLKPKSPRYLSSLAAPGQENTVTNKPKFYVFGQRYTTDDHVLSLTGWNRPSSSRMSRAEDVAYAIGSNAAKWILKKDIRRYKTELTSKLKKSVKLFNSNYYKKMVKDTTYHAWINSLRYLFKKPKTGNVPAFMKTRSWEYLKLNTALGSYAELKHDTILYREPVYISAMCGYPEGYVEPNPQFFNAMKIMAIELARKLKGLAQIAYDNIPVRIKQNAIININFDEHFKNFAKICEILKGLATKGLNGQKYTKKENIFIKSTVMNWTEQIGCGPPTQTTEGWYTRLFYKNTPKEYLKYKPIVSDIVNDPANNRIRYIATGMTNYGVFAVKCNGKTTLYTGPVYSFYQFNRTFGNRLTDDQWGKLYIKKYKNKRIKWAYNFLVNPNSRTRISSRAISASTLPRTADYIKWQKKQHQIRYFNKRFSNYMNGNDENFYKYMTKHAKPFKKAVKLINSILEATQVINQIRETNPNPSSRHRGRHKPGTVEILYSLASQENVYSVHPLTGQKFVHGTYMLFDNDVRTAWVANRSRGIGAFIKIYLKKKNKINKIKIRPGYDYMDPEFGDLFKKNNHLKKIKITFYSDANNTVSSTKFVEFDGTRGMKTIPIDNVNALIIKIEILDVYSGYRYPNDTAISELEIYGE